MLRTIRLVAATMIIAAPAFAQDEGSSDPAPRTARAGSSASKAPSTSPSVDYVSSTSIATTVFSNIPGHPTAAVPGYVGLEFDPGTGSSQFDRPYGSPNGNWVLTALTNDPSTSNDEVLLLNGIVALKEGDVAPWDVANNLGTFDTQIGVNDAGEYVFAMNLAPTTVNDDYIIKVTNSGATFNVVAQESGAVTTLPGNTYDDILDSALILKDGTVGFQADGIDGLVTTTTDEIAEIGNTLIFQENVTLPGGQMAGTLTELAENIDFEDMWVDPNGATILWLGDLTGPTTTDDVVVVNNTVVLQEGVVIPGSGFANPIDGSGIVNVSVDYGGNWYARGNNDLDEIDWVVRNGAVLAAVGLPITPGSSEIWDDTDFSDCFFGHTGNGIGDTIVAGVTSEDSTRNGVVIFNGNQVVIRENEPVDLDNNGQFDDGVYFNTFGNDDFVLSDARELYFTATIRDAAGTVVGQGFFKKVITVCAGGPVSEFGVGCVGTVGVAPVLTGIGCATPGGPLTIAITDGVPNSQAVLFIGVAPLSSDIGGGCTLYLNPLIPLFLPLDATGSVTIPAVIPVTSPLATALLQAFNGDGGAPLGFTASNGLSVTIQ